MQTIQTPVPDYVHITHVHLARYKSRGSSSKHPLPAPSMTSPATTVQEYLTTVAPDKLLYVNELYEAIKSNLPPGFQEGINYGMLGWVVPHSIYPAGYHVDPKQALPFLGLAAQKNFVAVYHMGMYSNPQLLNWFTTQYASRVKGKLDMGKSCIRLKKYDPAVIELVAELATKMTVEDCIAGYEAGLAQTRT